MSPPKSAQNSRKSSNFYNSQSNGNWKSDYSVKCNKCNKIHQDNHSDEEGRLEMKTSDETISATHSEDNTEDAYAQEPGNQTVYPCDYYQYGGTRTHAEAVLAKLKELQWRRDALERHYTYGVRKIINDYFFQNSTATRGDIAAVEERMRAGGIKKSQSGGVRLDCGCTHFCERNLPKSVTKQSGSQSANYSGDCRARCSPKYDAARSPRNNF